MLGATMAASRSTRRSRKRRGTGSSPRLPSAPRRETHAERRIAAEREQRRAHATLGTYGERPPGPFAPIPVSEIAIFAGGTGALIGLVSGAAVALIVGIVVCTLGVLEVTAREHFSGYRSHATLLAAVPAVALVAVGAAVFGTPRQRSARELMLAAALPVFGLLFWLLRKRFRVARQARVVRPPRS
jgi:hypothetical protein